MVGEKCAVVAHVPLTLEQVFQQPTGLVYLEYRFPEYCSGYRTVGWIKAWLGHVRSPNRALYGKTWRCWSTKPTAADSFNSDWEVIHDL